MTTANPTPATCTKRQGTMKEIVNALLRTREFRFIRQLMRYERLRSRSTLRDRYGRGEFKESDHPRDADGKFGSGGSKKSKKPESKKPESKDSKPKAMSRDEIAKAYPPMNAKGPDTQSRYQDKNGQYTTERKALHESVISRVIQDANVTKSENPTVYMLGGGTASGKSSVMKAAGLGGNMVPVDPDALKGELPEYNLGIEDGDHGAAGEAHEESSDLSKMILDRAAREKYDILMDGTGDSGFEKLKGKIEKWKAAGHKVAATYVSIPTEEAVLRATERGRKSGRHVEVDVIREIHSSVSQVVPQAIKAGLYDSFQLYDNNVPHGDPPIKVAEASGTDLKVHNQKLWTAFLAKGE